MGIKTSLLKTQMSKRTEKDGSSVQKKLARIRSKIRAGRSLTPEEKALLKKHAPELYMEFLLKGRKDTVQERQEKKRRQEKETKRIREQKRLHEKKMREIRTEERMRQKRIQEKMLEDDVQEEHIMDYTDKKKALNETSERKVQERLDAQRMLHEGVMDPLGSEVRASELSEAAEALSSGHATGLSMGRAAYSAAAGMAELKSVQKEIGEYNKKV